MLTSRAALLICVVTGVLNTVRGLVSYYWGNWAPGTGGSAGGIPGEPLGRLTGEPSELGYVHRFFK